MEGTKEVEEKARDQTSKVIDFLVLQMVSDTCIAKSDPLMSIGQIHEFDLLLVGASCQYAECRFLKMHL